MTEDNQSYVPALRFNWLTPYYDLIVRITTREKVFRKKLLELVPADTARLLDLGCGTGSLACMIKHKYPKMQVCGLDGDRKILKRAAHKAGKAGLEIEFKQGMSFALPCPDHSYDVLITSLFFHHLSDDEKRRTLLEVRRVLTKTGQLLLCDWGRSTNPLLRTTFLLVRLLDGFAVTAANASGQIPGYITEAGFSRVQVYDQTRTMLGALDLISASNA